MRGFSHLVPPWNSRGMVHKLCYAMGPDQTSHATDQAGGRIQQKGHSREARGREEGMAAPSRVLCQGEEGPLPPRPAPRLAQGVMSFRTFAGEPSITTLCLSGVHRIEKKADVIQSREESLEGVTGVKGGLPFWPELGSGETALGSNGNCWAVK